MVGRVVSLEDGRATIQAFPTPRLPATTAVVKAAQKLTRAKGSAEEFQKAYGELEDEVRRLEGLGIT